MCRYRLIAARKNCKWTQAEVAEKLNITESFYGMLEQGSRNPRLTLALNIEKLFNVPVAKLFSDLFLYRNQTQQTTK
ncbi:MAG: helix-turn-helix transcriptional regulator [Clostridia bacterium]|nr:helix-turn-helix transcriptional regulator [Clostridia bacterium]MDD4049299.1 helix-turn-helix transcriptional regulator [Clostridia bacterium]